MFDVFKDEKILENVQEVGHYLWNQLEMLKENNDNIVDHRGIGLIQGLEFKDNPSAIVKKALEKGLVLIAAANNTIRFVPPLIITRESIQEMLCMLNASME